MFVTDFVADELWNRRSSVRLATHNSEHAHASRLTQDGQPILLPFDEL
jgi:hypothetical protein